MLRYRAFPYFGVLNILGTAGEEFPAASYPEIKNQVADEEKASPVLV